MTLRKIHTFFVAVFICLMSSSFVYANDDVISRDNIIAYQLECVSRNFQEDTSVKWQDICYTNIAHEVTFNERAHAVKEALDAEKEFNKVFKEKKAPTKIPGIKIKEKKLPVLDLLVKAKLVSSKAEAKRLILQKGVKINEKVQDSWQKDVEIKKGMIIQVGKRRFVKLN